MYSSVACTAWYASQMCRAKLRRTSNTSVHPCWHMHACRWVTCAHAVALELQRLAGDGQVVQQPQRQQHTIRLLIRTEAKALVLRSLRIQHRLPLPHRAAGLEQRPDHFDVHGGCNFAHPEGGALGWRHACAQCLAVKTCGAAGSSRLCCSPHLGAEARAPGSREAGRHSRRALAGAPLQRGSPWVRFTATIRED